MMRLSFMFKSMALFHKNSRANVATLFALTAPILIGALGLGVETAYWYVDQRGMQNAADAAAIAAASNGSGTYANEAAAVASQYGYQDGANAVTVATSNAAACPSGGNNCYSVSITMKQPL
jgi:Flp pilus assembly protein TadG